MRGQHELLLSLDYKSIIYDESEFRFIMNIFVCITVLIFFVLLLLLNSKTEGQ